MTDSILITIKQMLGLIPEDVAFDPSVIANINTVFMILHQLGIGPTTVYQIIDNEQKWLDFTTDLNTYSAVKSYIYLKVKLIFDPPPNSFTITAFENLCRELEIRLALQAEQTPAP